MDEKIVFRAEIEFRGTIAEFRKLQASLEKLPITGRVAEWLPGHDEAGCWPLHVGKILPIKELEEVLAGKPRVRIRPFPGGLRVPHFHIKDEVVLVERKEFKKILGEAARELAGRLAEKAGYAETIGAIRNLVPGAK
jgi:hypothetical protein